MSSHNYILSLLCPCRLSGVAPVAVAASGAYLHPCRGQVGLRYALSLGQEFL